MTLALLLTAVTGAWAEDFLYLVVDGTSATMMYGAGKGDNPYYTIENGNGYWYVLAGPEPDTYYDKEKLTTVTIDASCKKYTGTTLRSLFDYWSKLTTINNLENLNTSAVTDMYRMFAVCQALTSLDLSCLNTASVTNMEEMFIGLTLETIDLSGWNTSSVTNMYCMFYSCSNLKNIYVGDGWSTAAVTNSNFMFDGCSKLPNWNGTVTHAMAKLADDGGYLQKKPEGIELAWDPVTKTATLDEMPEGNVVVDVEYYSRAGVTLADGQYPAGCTAALMDTTFGAWTTENKLMEGQRFVLMIERPGGWDYTTSFDKGGASKDFMKEFTKDEYKAYIAYAKAQGLTVPDNAVLKWVTMPDTDDEDLTLGVSFVKQQTYTVMLVDEGYNMTFEKFCRFAVMQGEE